MKLWKYIGGGLATLLLLDVVFIEPRRLLVRTDLIKTRGAISQRLRIAHVSDIHLGAPGIGRDKLAKIVDEIRGMKPDLILFSGDFLINGVLGGHFIPASELTPYLKTLNARYGKYAVLGNHDWWTDTEALKHELAASNITVLENEATQIQAGEKSFWLVGVGDDYTEHADFDKAIQTVPASEKPIIFTHDPAAYLTATRDAELYLAGHTHGGQVYLPYIGALIIPGRSPNDYAYGWINKSGQRIRVTSGIGTSVLPVRFNMPPEIAIIDIMP